MEDEMAKRAGYTLNWSSSKQAYELYEGQRSNVLDMIPAGPAWLVWLSQTCSFAFSGQNGSFRARKERNKGQGEGYWYAYTRIEGKLTKRYLGRSIDLTLTRLEKTAQALQSDAQVVLHQKRDRPRLTSATAHKENVFLPDSLNAADSTLRDDPQDRLLHFNSSRATGQHRVHYDKSADRRKKENERGAGLKAQTSSAISSLPNDMLLASKLQAPRPRPHLVHRPRLIQRLQQGLDKTLILLSAPAGFGKSTLLGDWLASCGIPAAWLSLESRDNDPGRFLTYLLAALHDPDPGLSTAMQNLPHPLHRTCLENVLTSLINGLQARMSEDQEHAVLVLDDYHVISNGSIHAALSFLLEHLPAHLHLILATRQDPPLPLARLRGRDDLLELRASDLRFTHEETTTYLVEKMGLPLSTEESALLQTRTEGWITGLHLAALSLQNCDDPLAFIATFSGTHHHVMDYLLEEVLNRQSQAIQDFLLQTSLLDRLSASLCDAVRGQHDSQAKLGFLEQANLFLVPLDDERRWYRYHHLFADVLRQQLQQTTPTQIPILHLRASNWFEQHGLIAEAISHAQAASGSEEAASLIKQHTWTFVLGNQQRALHEQLQGLSEGLIMAHPSLHLLNALALMNTHHWEAASAHLQTIEQGARHGENTREERDLLGQVVASQSLLACFSGDLEGYVSLSQRALDLLSETNTTPLTRMLRGEAILGAAHAYLVSGDVTAASERLLAETTAFARASADHQLLLPRGLNLLARLQVLQGRLRQAATTYEEIGQLVKKHEEVQILADISAYYFGLGDLLREWNELEAAEQHLARGMDLFKGMFSIDAETVWLGYAATARVQQAQGRDNQALATLDAFMQRAQHYRFAPSLLAQGAALRAQLELTQGRLQAAHRWAASSGLTTCNDLSYLQEREYLTFARVRIAEERISPTASGLSEVQCLLERLLDEAETRMRLHSVIEILLLLALAFEVQADHDWALITLGRALAMAEPEGYLRLFLDEGPPMLALLHRAQQHGLAQDYIARLLAAASKTRSTDQPRCAPQPDSPMEPLTRRERDVLWLVLEGASNREIARQLVLSVNTVKKHILNIYGKLNVQSRAQAIAKARRLNLL
jgi:LuxR family transcriptional regulator, maltose regulon positive regulatory protein